MDFASIISSAFPEGEALKIAVDGVTIWEKVVTPTIKNLVLSSVEADGTPYNGGLGYKTGYRIRSGGAEGASTYAVCTGFMPCKAGETLYVKCPPAASGKEMLSINVADANRTNLGQLAYNGVYGVFQGGGRSWSDVELANDIYKYTIPTDIQSASDVVFVRVTIQFAVFAEITGEGFIVTVNQEITN